MPSAASLTVTIDVGRARASYARGADALATLALALHEAGHALLRVNARGSRLAIEPAARWLDEAVAAWAVRGLEDPSLIADPDLRRRAAARRQRREALTRRLAAFERAVLAGASPAAAWTESVAPACVPALFDEPGVMASYAAADRWPQACPPRMVAP
ncbi:MAG: hypothetical protein HS111_37280 [Kofleriaceae bacterium]|nr:hypothetical protein [Kofleriaceae bacterium]